MLNNNLLAFFTLLRAGLWEHDAKLSQFGEIDFGKLYQLAEEQTVLGLVTAGLEHITDRTIPQEVALSFAGAALQIEQRNIAMNDFLEKLVMQLRNQDVYTLLIKGQGIAQCYERPNWRTCGDIDFFLSDDNYTKAKSFCDSVYKRNDKELVKEKHVSYTTGEWVVELHGTMRTTLLNKLDKVIDEVQEDIFYNGNVRRWMNGQTQVFLPSPNNDLFLVYSHFLKHFFNGGIGLRQICDWCRLLWTFREEIDAELLYTRLSSAGVVTEWKVFAMFAVKYLGMPEKSIPFYSPSERWGKKTETILSVIIKDGNFGYNREKDTLYVTSLERGLNRLKNITRDLFTRFSIFPLDSMKVWVNYVSGGMRNIIKRA